MSHDQLIVDTESVRSLATNLHTVHDALDHAQSVSDSLRAAVGHPHLGNVVHDFAAKWDDRRKDLMDQMDTLKKTATAVADGFEQVDCELAKALTEDAAS